MRNGLIVLVLTFFMVGGVLRNHLKSALLKIRYFLPMKEC